MARADRRAVVVVVDQSFSALEFRARLEAESLHGAFFLVLYVDDDLEVTMAMARVWLSAVIDRQVPMQHLVVATRAPQNLHMVQALALAARLRGSSRSVETAGSIEEAVYDRQHASSCPA